MFFFLRIMPFLFLVFPLVIITASIGEIPRQAIYLMSVAMLIPAIILLNIAYITEVEISTVSIRVVSNTFKGTKEEDILLYDIDKIICRKRYGKKAGLFYYLVLKTAQKRKRFISFHGRNIKESKRQFINERLQKITGISVLNK
jgi:hypothetical protein